MGGVEHKGFGEQRDLDFYVFSSHLYNGDKTYLWLLKVREDLARNFIFVLSEYLSYEKKYTTYINPR